MGRGKQYDLQKMLDLYNKGYSYQEIADEFQTKSVQSVRHAIEKRLKEDIAFDQALINFDKAETEKKKLKEEEESKKIEEKMKPVRMGIFDFRINNQTMDALEYFLQNKYGSKVLIDKTNRVISISEELDPEEMKDFLFRNGFLMLIDNLEYDDVAQLNIEVFHSAPGSTISMVKETANIFQYLGGYEETNEVRLAVVDLIKSGRINFDGVTLNIIDQSVNIDSIRRAIKSSCYSATIAYCPTCVLEMHGRKIVAVDGNQLFTITNISYSEFESLIRASWRKYYGNLERRWMISVGTPNEGVDVKIFYNDYSQSVMEDFSRACSSENMEIYKPYFEKANEQIEMDLTYFNRFKEISLSEIGNMISEDFLTFTIAREIVSRIGLI